MVTRRSDRLSSDEELCGCCFVTVGLAETGAICSESRVVPSPKRTDLRLGRPSAEVPAWLHRSCLGSKLSQWFSFDSE